MNKAVPFLKKTFKVILWVIIVFVLLFIVIAMLIQIPAIQKKIVNYATSYISNKTHTKVNIKNISISFPKSIVIEGLYLEDVKKDTLLYAGEVKVMISFNDLLNKNIHISSFILEEVNLNINRIKSDSLFNYNFLLTSFSDTSKIKKVETITKSKWTFSIDNVSTKNIKLQYNDDYGGMIVAANLKQLKLKMDRIDLEKSIYSIDELIIDNFNARVLMKNSLKTKEEKSESILPKITANKIHINNTNFLYEDYVGKQSLIVNINKFKLNEVSLDLQNEIVDLDKLFLSKSKILYNTVDTELSPDITIVESNITTRKSNWKVSVKSIDLNDNSLAYVVANKHEAKNTFNASHLDYKHLTFIAKNFYYSSEKTEVSIKKFSTIDQNNFSITKLETDFSMDQHSIKAKNLKVKTTNSSIDADLIIKYSSLKSLSDSLQFMIINADMKNVSITNSDILYFNPKLIEQAFFKNTRNITFLSGVIIGALNNLKGKNLLIKTGVSSILKTDFIIKGLPDIETAYFDFPNLKINSNKLDIAVIAGSSIPKSIELPEYISVQMVFNGQLKSFETTLEISSSYGFANLYVAIDKNENFKTNAIITNFDLGALLKDTSIFGHVSLTADSKGHGLGIESIKANINAEVSQIYLNKYNYQNIKLDASINGQLIDGGINIDDKNIKLDIDGLVNLSPKKEQYKLNLNLHGANLFNLNFAKEDIQIGLIATFDFKSGFKNHWVGLGVIIL